MFSTNNPTGSIGSKSLPLSVVGYYDKMTTFAFAISRNICNMPAFANLQNPVISRIGMGEVGGLDIGDLRRGLSPQYPRRTNSRVNKLCT
jgi:hypothetical protein